MVSFLCPCPQLALIAIRGVETHYFFILVLYSLTRSKLNTEVEQMMQARIFLYKLVKKKMQSILVAKKSFQQDKSGKESCEENCYQRLLTRTKFRILLEQNYIYCLFGRG